MTFNGAPEDEPGDRHVMGPHAAAEEGPPEPAPDESFDGRRDGAALAGLFALSAWFTAVSWRKWPDALVDFGRELYTPWRMAEGAVLYRDLDSYYGPLSLHLNALWFRHFGPGLMVLVLANLVVFAGIVVLMYGLCRRAWGRVAALGACGMFVAVFGFSQLTALGNYNFATPYAHESTHGFLVCLGLVAVLDRWIRSSSRATSMAAGGLWGLTAVLKPEFMLAGGVVTATALAWRWRHCGRPAASLALAWSAAALTPSALFAIHFAQHVPWTDVVNHAGRAWMNVLGSSAAAYAADPIQASFIGIDRPIENLVRHARAAAAAIFVLAGVAGLAWVLGRTQTRWIRHALTPGVAGVIAVVGLHWIDWLEVGPALPGLVTLAGLLAVGAAWHRVDRPHDAALASRALALLLVVLGGALLLRMGLNARIHHYGFYQAALASVVVTATLLGDLPRRLSRDAWTRRAVLVAVALLLGTGAGKVAARSAAVLALKVEPIGEERDRFFGYPPEVWSRDALVKSLVNELRRQPADETLVVVPEGAVINYLTRRPSPVPFTVYFTSTTYGDGEARVVRSLEAHPPDWVVIISRPLTEYGVLRYGEEPGGGKLILDWVAANYEVVKRGGGDPLDPVQLGAILLRRMQHE